MKKYAYGVDIGGTTVKIGFFETTGKLVDTWDIPTRTENSGELILPDIAASIKENNEKHGIEMGYIEGVGMGVPGPIKAVSYTHLDVYKRQEVARVIGLDTYSRSDFLLNDKNEMFCLEAKDVYKRQQRA